MTVWAALAQMVGLDGYRNQLMEGIVNSVLASMSSVKKPQRLFLMGLFSLLGLFQGKETFRNLSRYSEMHEKRFSRWCAVEPLILLTTKKGYACAELTR
jgi:hypothetical protein